MKRTTLFLTAALASFGASGADKAIATFALTFRLNTSTYTDVVVINQNDGDGEYSGYDAKSGRQVWAVKNGPMLCASVINKPIYGVSYCFPYDKKFSAKAFVIHTICDAGVILDYCTGIPVTASVTRSKNAISAAQALREEEVESEEQQKVLELKDKLLKNGNPWH
ncbi:hypothetical protein [Methylococcus geothermalis]|uniref:Uncharacterized protein n=1 Tax=Methylococcus geothermalis TaxID=2681310 RepID=A0A858Q5F0_9GAMM|nr:hypothetical protein [Methylococcus geothermalis]QJD29035.1 hypothetical protein GNH96_02980 [Methylococcus geothermalis]